MGGAAALAAGAPGAARACPGDGGAYDQVIPTGSPVAIGELKSLKVTCLSEVGWWSTPQFLADIDAMEAASFDVIASNHCTGITAVEKMLARNFPVAMGSASFGSKSNRYVGNGDSIVF